MLMIPYVPKHACALMKRMIEKSICSGGYVEEEYTLGMRDNKPAAHLVKKEANTLQRRRENL